MGKVIMLTRTNCSQCNSLKMFLKTALGGKYDENILIINEDDEKGMFDTYVEEYSVKALPTLIYKDNIIYGLNILKTKELFEINFGKK